MYRFIQTVFTSFTIWIAASMLNGLMIAFILIIENRPPGQYFEMAGIAFLLTLLFSIPAAFVFWLFFIINFHKARLLQILLKTALCSSLASGIAFTLIVHDKIVQHNYMLVLAIVCSAIGAVLLHANKIRHIIQTQHI